MRAGAVSSDPARGSTPPYLSSDTRPDRFLDYFVENPQLPTLFETCQFSWNVSIEICIERKQKQFVRLRRKCREVDVLSEDRRSDLVVAKECIEIE